MIGLIGINHQTADLDKRSAFALSSAEASLIVEDWIACDFVKGAVILSTCNRVEIYYEVEDTCPSAGEHRLIHSLLNNLELSPRYADLLIAKRGNEAYEHLFRLASGLESMVIGETQILGQLKEAYRMASLSGHCSGVLSRLFHRSFEVAKKVRSEYVLNTTPISAGSAAVDKLLAVCQPKQVLIVGAGLMADTIYDHLLHRGATNIVVYNRTRERAERFKESHSEARIAYEGALDEELKRAEAIIVATSAPSPIVKAEHLPIASGDKTIIDLAVPRNVAPEVDTLEHITLYTIDALEHLGERIDEDVQLKIKDIIDEYVQIHQQWMEGAQMREAIGIVQKTTGLLLERELELSRGSLTADEFLKYEAHSEHFKTTISTAIIAALRKVSEYGRRHRYVDAIQAVFLEIQNKLYRGNEDK